MTVKLYGLKSQRFNTMMADGVKFKQALRVSTIELGSAEIKEDDYITYYVVLSGIETIYSYGKNIINLCFENDCEDIFIRKGDYDKIELLIS